MGELRLESTSSVPWTYTVSSAKTRIEMVGKDGKFQDILRTMGHQSLLFLT